MEVDDLLARHADEMMMRAARPRPRQGRLVAPLLVERVHVADRSGGAERFQVLVDGGEGKIRQFLPHREEKLLRGRVIARGGERGEDGKALLGGRPLSESVGYLKLLAAYDIVFVSLASFLFRFTVDE